MNTAPTKEPILEPELPIIDPHHHMWVLSAAHLAAMVGEGEGSSRALADNFRRHARYLIEELTADVTSGHNIRATVYMEAHAMYRAAGPEHFKSLGEVEFANGMAAMSASGNFGNAKLCAGIVGSADLRLGEDVRAVLFAHLQACGGRYRGIRPPGVTYDDTGTFGAGVAGTPHLLLDSKFRAGFKQLAPLGLSCDLYLLDPQLPDLIDLARAFPETQIILNHVGGVLGVGPYRPKERFPIWRDNIRALAKCPNVVMKLGGLGMPLCGLLTLSGPSSSQEMADAWRPHMEASIEAFGASRCMFESNFPVDASAGEYPVVWNAFKRIASGASKEDKTALFSGTAARVYKIEM
jgi:L-fuconolactonase